jgi:hypothetical protein
MASQTYEATITEQSKNPCKRFIMLSILSRDGVGALFELLVFTAQFAETPARAGQRVAWAGRY